MSISKEQARSLIKNDPIKIGNWLGFRDLTEMHNEWLKLFLFSEIDITLQGHRGSYKTTVLSLFFALHAITAPYRNVLYFRKTDTDVQEISRQTANILQTPLMHKIGIALYGHDYVLTKISAGEIDTSLGKSVKGASQIVGLGIGTSITGKHADIVVTDDIVNLSDRQSRAERERTKRAYLEMQNIKNRGGRFINTGTPWHIEDCFSLMPEPVKFDCYSTGLITEEKLEELKRSMPASLFAANYELKHIASEDALFTYPQKGAEDKCIINGIAHVDSAFYGEDYTAFSIMAYHDGKYYLFGKLWRKHVEDCYSDIKGYYEQYLCGKLYNETNADKGMVAKDMRKLGMRVATYAEHMNKHVKISTYLKAIWSDLYFVEGTDEAYINQICDYTEDAEHDDAPDSAACLARLLYNKSKDEYKPLF